MLWQGADYVIALTHMRMPNDIRLAENVDSIDLILGGHDHDYEVMEVSTDVCVVQEHSQHLFEKSIPREN